MDMFKRRGQPRQTPAWPALGWFRQFVAADAAAAPDRYAVAAFVDVDSCFGKLQVLVVDDEPVNLMVASALLSGCGITPLLATDGAQAVALTREQQFDLILMDLQMPVLDGLGAAKQIRRIERELANPRAAIVAYTAMSPTEALLQACGIDGLLEKPCGMVALQDCLTRWCLAGAGAMAAPARTGSRERSAGL